MKKLTKQILTLLLVIAMLMLSACAAPASAPQATAAPEATAAPAVTAAPEATPAAEPSTEKKVIGMVVKETTAPYIQAFMKGAQETADKLGIDLIIQDGEGDSIKIINIIDNFIVQEIDGFILAGAVDLKAVVPGIEKLNAENIPVMALDTCPEGGKVDMFITFDIVKSSEKAAAAMIEGIKERNGGEVPKGVVIEITGALVDMFTTDCHTGFMNIVSKYPQLTVAQGEGNWNNDDSYSRTTDLLTRHGDDVLAIYVHTPDIMGTGAISAIEAAGLDPKNYGLCGICIGPEGIELIKEKKVYAIVEQPALDSAVLAIKYMNDEFNGVALPEIGTTVTEEGALWSPATIVKNDYASEGRTMILQGPLVPTEIAADDPGLWENRIK